jgi:uncharacterized protein YjbI with pentapeptide repeats
MVEIRHHTTGAVLHRLDIPTLERASLSGMNFCDADLAGANLVGANLVASLFRGTRLRGANLSRANLTGAYLLQADLSDANLSGALMLPDSLDGADLTGANLAGADLTGAYLAEAKLVRANLSFANLQHAYLGGADLSGATLGSTILAQCPSLHQITGLATTRHVGPSTVDLATLRACVGNLPDAFLQGVGLTKGEIDTLRALYAQPVPSPSCLLVSAAADRDFTDRLRADLLTHDILCWHYCPDLGAGYLVQTVFTVAMKQHDRLVLVCSRQSLLSPGIADAVLHGIERERETGERKLFPVLVDGFLLSNELRRMADEKIATGEWRGDWVGHVREHLAADSQAGTEPAAYSEQLRWLMNALKRTPSG